jgi:hypothetical protein
MSTFQAIKTSWTGGDASTGPDATGSGWLGVDGDGKGGRNDAAMLFEDGIGYLPAVLLRTTAADPTALLINLTVRARSP